MVATGSDRPEVSTPTLPISLVRTLWHEVGGPVAAEAEGVASRTGTTFESGMPTINAIYIYIYHICREGYQPQLFADLVVTQCFFHLDLLKWPLMFLKLGVLQWQKMMIQKQTSETEPHLINAVECAPYGLCH